MSDSQEKKNCPKRRVDGLFSLKPKYSGLKQKTEVRPGTVRARQQKQKP